MTKFVEWLKKLFSLERNSRWNHGKKIGFKESLFS